MNENASRPPRDGEAETSSHGEILRSSALLGSASILNILIGAIRVKVFAYLLGPAGVGLMGLLSSALGIGTALAGLGLAPSSVRQLAAGQSDPAALAVTRRTLFWGSMGLGLAGAFACVMLREPIAMFLFHDTSRATDVGWLSLGIWLSLVGSAQGSLLNGFRRMRDMAIAGVLGSVAATVMGVAIIWFAGEAGVVWFVIAGPLTSVAVLTFFCRRLPPLATRSTSPRAMLQDFRTMAGLGVTLMMSGFLGTLSQMLVRVILSDQLDLAAVGHFQAAWSISMQYLGLILAAMGADYYPRLTQAVSDGENAHRILNEQVEVAFLLAGPILIGMIAVAPWVIALLYSQDFADATPILRWQVLGDVFKVASWPLGFLLLASNSGRAFFASELFWHVFYVAFVWFALPVLGLEATGVGFAIGYLVYFGLVTVICRRLFGLGWSRANWRLFVEIVGLSAAVYVACLVAPVAGAIAGVAVAIAFGIVSVSRLSKRVKRLARLQARLTAFFARPRV